MVRGGVNLASHTLSTFSRGETNMQFIHTTGLQLSLSVTASVQNVLFHPQRPEASNAIHQ